jgi:hypothetical protein
MHNVLHQIYIWTWCIIEFTIPILWLFLILKELRPSTHKNGNDAGRTIILWIILFEYDMHCIREMVRLGSRLQEVKITFLK